MKKNFEISELVSLLKVFDSGYALDKDCEKVNGLNIDEKCGVEKAVAALLLPEFDGYSQRTKDRLVKTLEYFCSEDESKFSEAFERVSLIFDKGPMDRKHFLNVMLSVLKSAC